MRVKVQQPTTFDQWDRLRGETLAFRGDGVDVEGRLMGVFDEWWLMLRLADGGKSMLNVAAVADSEVILVREAQGQEVA